MCGDGSQLPSLKLPLVSPIFPCHLSPCIFDGRYYNCNNCNNCWNQSHFCDSLEKGGDEWYGDITVLSHSENCVVTLNVYEWKCNQIQSWHGG